MSAVMYRYIRRTPVTLALAVLLPLCLGLSAAAAAGPTDAGTIEEHRDADSGSETDSDIGATTPGDNTEETAADESGVSQAVSTTDTEPATDGEAEGSISPAEVSSDGDDPTDAAAGDDGSTIAETDEPTSESAESPQAATPAGPAPAAMRTPAPAEEPASTRAPFIGIGANLGLRLFGPGDVSDWADEVIENIKSGYTMIGGGGTTALFGGLSLQAHVLIRPVPLLCISPTVRYLVSTKKFAVNSMRNVQMEVDIRAVGVGGEVYLVAPPRKTLSFKAGVAAEYQWVSIDLTEDNTVELAGSGFTLAPMAGLNIKPGRVKGRVMINVDFMAPISFGVDLTKENGEFTQADDDDAWNVPLPGSVSLTGFEIRPGVTYCF